MGIELSDTDRAGMTPEEIEALTGEGAEANLRAFGAPEDETPAGDAACEDGATPEAADKPAGDTPPKKDGEAAEPTGDELPGADELVELLAEGAPQPLAVEGPKDFKAERQALRDKKADVEKQWAEAQITDEQRTQALQEIDDQIDDLLIAHTRAETLRNYNAQQAEAQMNAAVTSVLKQAKAAGSIDYAKDQKAAVQFDQFLSAHIADPDNAGKSAAELTSLAHKSVLAYRGIVEKPANPEGSTQNTQPTRRDIPPSLGGVPSAAPTLMENDALAKFQTLSGDDAEDYLASLPAAEQARILRAADATAMQHSNDNRNTRRQRAAARA